MPQELRLIDTDSEPEVEINITLLDAKKKIPKYAKFLKELYVHKRKRSGIERHNVDVDQKRKIHYWSTTSTAKEVLRPRNFLCPMYHWQLYHQWHAGLRSFNYCHANINLKILEFW
ncbi:hypothetical protein CR513_39212, partial [Mucuna pruriens]